MIDLKSTIDGVLILEVSPTPIVISNSDPSLAIFLVRFNTVFAVNWVVPDPVTPPSLWTDLMSSKLKSLISTTLLPSVMPLIINGSFSWNCPVTSLRYTFTVLVRVDLVYPTAPLFFPSTRVYAS